LNQIPPISRHQTGGYGPEYPVSGRNTAAGEFQGTARWLTSAYGTGASGKDIIAGQHPSAGIGAEGEDPRDPGDELGALMAAIAAEVYGHAAAAREGVMADFAARVAHARKHQSKSVLAATLGAIKEQRKAALALISRNAALELAARRNAVVEMFRGKGQRGPSNRSKQIGGQNQGPTIS
jgi:hypothetical protein